MKYKLLLSLLTVSLFSSTVMAESEPTNKPIAGAFGYLFGAPFNPNDATQAIKDEKGTSYLVPPKVLSDKFQYYMLRLTPNHKIAQITAISKRSDTCNTDKNDIISNIKDKYNLTSIENKKNKNQVLLHNGATYIVLECENKVLKAVYSDSELLNEYYKNLKNKS